MQEIRIRDNFIKLGQLLKLIGAAGSGVEAKSFIIEGYVKVNGNTELQRGKKIYPGDEVVFKDDIYKVIN